MLITPTFIAYPDKPGEIGDAIEAAVSLVHQPPGQQNLVTWRGLAIGGQFIASRVHEGIDNNGCLIADLSVLNDNVTYEVGYAIGRQKRLLLIMNNDFPSGKDEIDKLGIFDTIGWLRYANSEQLAPLILNANSAAPLQTVDTAINQRAPVFMLEGMIKTEANTRIVSCVKKRGLRFRSFDPNETPRMSAHDVIAQVAQSHGILVTRLVEGRPDHRFHNLRASFIAGLAIGMSKEVLIIQTTDDRAPLDYRDNIVVCQSPRQIEQAVDEFASRVTLAFQNEQGSLELRDKPLIQRLNLGSSAAENEFTDLAEYFVETDIFRRALRGEVRIALGRKGSGKTALFSQIRDKKRADRGNIILDLRPEGYQLIKFKEDIQKLLQAGSFEHTISALWEYVLLIELAYKLLEKDIRTHTIDHRLYEPYRRLYELYRSDEYVTEGDFSERLSRLLTAISDDLRAKYPDTSVNRLSEPEVTALIYKHDVARLRDEVLAYLKFKGEVWFLLDNLDKGWPTHGVLGDDLLIIRTLMEATRKLEHQLRSKGVPCQTIVFLRNDIFELLVSNTSDRGKEPAALVDWEDPAALKELLRLRLVYSGLPDGVPFEQLWAEICVLDMNSRESDDYLIERSLMRPRGLINSLIACVGFAINRRHQRIEADDIRSGLANYSRDLVRDIGLEVRDILGAYENVLYGFLGKSCFLTLDDVHLAFIDSGIDEADWPTVIDTLLWYGFLGCARPGRGIRYIYDVSYNIGILRAMIDQQPVGSRRYAVNPAFWDGLEIDCDDDGSG